MLKLPTWMFFFGLVLFTGCGNDPQKTPAQAETATPPTDELPVVERAEYVNWSQFPVGTMVKHVRETTNDVNKVIVTTTSRLARKTPEKVVIETQVTVDRGGEPLVNPPMELEYQASFRLPPNMDANKFALPDQNAKAIAEESVQFNGKDYPSDRLRMDWIFGSRPNHQQNVVLQRDPWTTLST